MSITESDLDRMILDEAAEPKPLPFSLLAELTNGFSDELEIGRGGFAVVYKAILENGDVAVKRLSSNTYMYEEQFHREIECLMKVKHKNIVRFLGYCVETQGNVGSYNGNFVMADLQQRLLCFEYLPKGNLHDYINDPSGGLDWKERYKIIKGICEGLRYLHQKNILHLDLKPENILLDVNMQPKITDFGLSRCFEEEQTRAITTKVIGTMGYLAPEYTSHVITQKFDLYSLGVIITEILTGMKGYQKIETILENWSKRLQISQDNPEWEQIKVCAEIGMECTKFNPLKRPLSMKHIMDRLVETEYDEVIITAAEPTELLVVHPLELYLPFEYKKLIPCSLNLTNNMNEPVAFRLVMDESEQPSSSCFVTLPVYGIVLPRTTYTLVVTTKFATEQVAETNNLILESTTLALGDHDMIKKFRKKPDEFLEKVKDTGTSVVHEVRLKAVSTHPPRETVTSSSSEPISPEIKMLSMGGLYTRSAFSLDINHSKQWIITGHDYGQIVIWNNQTQRMVGLFKVSSKTVTCVKFIARKQWFVVGTDDGIIHVYDYEAKMQKIKSFNTFYSSVESLIVHPTQPYLFSSHHYVWVVWDWSMDWKYQQTFSKDTHGQGQDELQLVFSPKDTIASTSRDNTIKVWSLDSTNSWHIFPGHSKKVNCLDFFTCYDWEYLVSGSDDRTAKIWDIQKKICVRTLDSLSAVTAVLYEPKLQILILGSKDGCIYLWCATNYRINSRSPRLERIVNIGTSIAVHSLACLMGRVVIGQENAVAIMNIDNDESNLQQPTNDYSEPLSSVYNCATRPAEDTTCEIMSRSSRGELLDVTLELTCFLCEPNECITWSLHLTNNTDEHVAFMLMDKRSEPLTKLPLYGIVPCKSSYTLIVSATKEELQETNLALILQSSTSGHNYASLFRDKTESQLFFEDAKEMGNDVHEVAVLLKADYGARQLEEAKSKPTVIPARIKIITVNTTGNELRCLDVHPTERWIITGHANGSICTWNHDTQGPLDTLEVSERSVTCVKVIARKQWIVAVTSDGSIHVYNCARVTTMEKIRTVRDAYPGLLAVHPIWPYVLSASRSMIFYWDEGWESRRPRKLRSMDVIEFINQKDTNMFAGAPSNEKNQIGVWNNVDFSCECSLSGHLEKVNCLHFFARDDAQFLISGSSDCTAKIWDWQKRECIHTMEVMSPVLCVISLPDRPYLVTGSYHGTVQLWSSTDFRLERTINFVEPILGLLCSMGSRRVVVGQVKAISILEIGSEEEAVANEGMSSTKRSRRRSRRKRN